MKPAAYHVVPADSRWSLLTFDRDQSCPTGRFYSSPVIAWLVSVFEDAQGLPSVAVDPITATGGIETDYALRFGDGPEISTVHEDFPNEEMALQHFRAGWEGTGPANSPRLGEKL